MRARGELYVNRVRPSSHCQSQIFPIMREVQKTVLILYEKHMRCVEVMSNQGNKTRWNHRQYTVWAEHKTVVGFLWAWCYPWFPNTGRIKTMLIHVLNDLKHALRWNGRGELLYDGNEIESFNIVHLFEDSQREYGNVRKETSREYVCSSEELD